jgi:hypothetical protein
MARRSGLGCRGRLHRSAWRRRRGLLATGVLLFKTAETASSPIAIPSQHRNTTSAAHAAARNVPLPRTPEQASRRRDITKWQIGFVRLPGCPRAPTGAGHERQTKIAHKVAKVARRGRGSFEGRRRAEGDPTTPNRRFRIAGPIEALAASPKSETERDRRKGLHSLLAMPCVQQDVPHGYANVSRFPRVLSIADAREA